MDALVVTGLIGLPISVAGFVASSLGLAGQVRRWFRQQVWDRARETHFDQIRDEAERINMVVDDLRALDRRVNHYRHNVHCPACGRFARQAEGWPTGVADCGLHGVGLRTTEWTGAVPVIVEEPPLLTGPIVLNIPDDISELLEVV